MIKAKYAVLAIALLILQGCVTRYLAPDQSFQPTIGESIVFGHLEIISDGQIIPIRTGLIVIKKQSESNDVFDRRIIDLRPDGYFIGVLPADKYKIISISRKGPLGKMCEGHQICDSFALTQRNPAIINFETTSGRATYIGSIKFIVSTKTNYFHLYQAPENAGKLAEKVLRYGLIGLALIPNSNPIQKVYVTKGECERKTLNCQKETETDSEDWKIEGNFEKVNKTFTSLYPNLQEPVENIAILYYGGKYWNTAPSPPGFYTTIPVTTGLSNYKILHLNVSSNISESQKSDFELKDQLINGLKEKRVFENIISISPDKDSSADLRLNLEIKESGEFKTRAPIPLFPSQPGTFVVVNGELVDLKTGKNNGSFRVESTCFNRFGCKKDDFKVTVEQIAEYILRNMY